MSIQYQCSVTTLAHSQAIAILMNLWDSKITPACSE